MGDTNSQKEVCDGHETVSVETRPLTLNILRWYAFAFVLLAVISAVAGFQVGRFKGVWARLGNVPSSTPAAIDNSQIAFDPLKADYSEITRLAPQQQAESLLESAIHRRQGSVEIIRQNVDGWRGRLRNTDRLFDLVLTALKSDDLQLRGAALDIDLAANNLTKSAKSIARLENQIRKDPAERPFALWRLGALGNRGVQPKTVLAHLVSYARDRNEQTRFWAVEGLAMLGTDGSVDALLERFAHDPSRRVRQRAGVALVQSAMLTHEQRLAAVPDLLNFLDDDSLDSDTRSWIYGALRLITGEPLGNDTHAWQEWWAHHDAPRKPTTHKGILFA